MVFVKTMGAEQIGRTKSFGSMDVDHNSHLKTPFQTPENRLSRTPVYSLLGTIKGDLANKVQIPWIAAGRQGDVINDQIGKRIDDC